MFSSHASIATASNLLVEGDSAEKRIQMDLLRIIAELKAEKRRLDEAIEALERLSARNIRRRGRPPKWLKKELKSQVGAGSEKANQRGSRRRTEPEIRNKQH
jgi:hypothetical protein